MDGGNQIPLRLWDFLQNFLINCTIKQYCRQMHPPLPQKGIRRSYKLFSDRLGRVVLMLKKIHSSLNACGADRLHGQTICLKGMILISLWQIQVLFLSSRMSVGEQDCMCGLAGDQTTSLNNHVYCGYYRKATVTSAGQQSKSAGEIWLFPSIPTLLSCSMSEEFIDYSLKLRVVTSKRSIMKMSI